MQKKLSIVRCKIYENNITKNVVKRSEVCKVLIFYMKHDITYM